MPRLWIDTDVDLTLASGAGATDSLMTGVSATQTRFDQMTLLRTIIGIDIAHAVHDSGEGSQLVSVGIGVASQEAIAAGVLADPQTDTDFPTRGWIWRARYRVYGFAADQPVVFNRRVDLDIRAMRKLENGEAYVNAFNAAEEGTTGAVLILGLIRQLWLVG